MQSNNQNKLLALIDCDNFYVSCERVFQPALQNRPAVVLSNNDGCIISRSNEAKQLGLKMGTPYFKAKKTIQQKNITVRSSNYTLYGDMARRMQTLLSEYFPRVEQYSIDEYFVELPKKSPDQLQKQLRRLKFQIKKFLGLPVSIGVGPTKTLTKIAMHIAKKTDHDPIQNTETWADIDTILSKIKIDQVWGIGPAYSKKSIGAGYSSALAFKNAPPGWVRKNLTVDGLGCQQELKGVRCFPLEQSKLPPRQIICSRMFCRPSSNYSDLKQAVIHYASDAGHRLRKLNMFTGKLELFIQNKKFFNSTEHNFLDPVRADHQLASGAINCLKKIYLPDISYGKCGVILRQLISDDALQKNLLTDSSKNHQQISRLVDTINGDMGKNTIKLLGEGIDPDWRMKRQYLSNRYTTSWQQLPVANSH